MNDPTRSKMRGEFDVFSPIIREELLDLGLEMVFYPILKTGECCERVIFMFQGIKPCIFCEVIYKYNIIFESIKRSN